ncbi:MULTISPECIES: ATP-binding protein [unclassified Rhizobium]|jgi:two-component system osmolarity sensor histidine kinase EnvZ|uniref:ATP-binding protein n=1 Tax=unclassified Rhizobium TaxID=2613769 RepID=UPI00064571C1|nr:MULTISPECIES: ATP-binding protein [unclassified Rhizobium]MBN8949151.1 HAMP domain-containing protein [Rhizobium tropici]OJY72361.1 MAG: two-component sensor histidine kinase [Rhizobium sp. 60-20]RKD50905.1 signal transduction histidine kinase [Rhizobium sp. WW_1]
MLKLGLVARIIMIVAAALFVIQLAAFVAAQLKPDTPFNPELSPAMQVKTAIRLLDAIPPEAQPLAVRALNANGLSIRLADAPAGGDGAGTSDLTLTDKLAREFAAIALGNRYFNMRSLSEKPQGWFSVGAPDRIMEVSIGVAGGKIAVFNLPDTPTVRLNGVPVGLIAGVLGMLVAVIAIAAVARETRPLTRLSRTVNSIGNGLQPVHIPERGACELRMLIKAINAMQLRIAALVSNRTLILGAISHDLRTYLTRFRLRMEMMPETPHRERAIADVEAMQRLVEDALGFARSTVISEGKTIIDLDAAIDAHLAERQDDDGLIAFAPIGQPLAVTMTETAFARVLDNLMDNALRYGGRADIAVEHRGEHGAIVVGDRGPGIPAERRKEVLEPFVRLEESRNRDLGGSGLGLAIVRQILDAHGGALCLEDREGGGLNAVVLLPLTMMERKAA